MKIDGLEIPDNATKVVADLKIQSMLFDMSVDWETLTLSPKSQHMDAVWLIRHKQKRADLDFNELIDVDRE